MSDFETLTIVGGKGPSAHDMKIYLGGKEITKSVKGIKFRAFAGEVITAELHLITTVGEIEIVHLRSTDLSDEAERILGVSNESGLDSTEG